MSVDFSNEADVIDIVVPGPTQVITLAVPGLQGPPGRLVVGTVTTGNPGTSAAVSAVDNAQGQQVVNFTIPRGDVGAPNTLAIGTVTTGTPGTSATASITGTAPNQTLSLTIPRGDVGATGPAGTITSATASSLPVGSTPTVTLGGTTTARTFAFGIPTGATGATGPTNTLSIGTVTTSAPGSSAVATITGTAPNQTLNLTLPQGAQGPTGAGAPDATSTAKGSIQLAGDIGGTAAVPTVISGANHGHTSAQISDATTIGRSVLTGASAAAIRTTIGATDLVIGTTATTAAAGNDSRLSDARTPTAHAASHASGGTDAVTPAAIGAALASHSHTASSISDSTAVGRSVLVAVDAPTARTAIGAGTSNLAIGTTNTTAKAGDYQPTAANISDATVIGRTVLTSIDAAAVRTAIGAGTSNLAIGTTNTTAKAGDYTPPADGAANVATMRTLGTAATQAAAGNDSRLSDARTPTAHTHTAANISDSTTVGRSVMIAVDAAAARTAIGAGTSSLVIGTTAGTAAAGNDSRLSDARTPTAHTHPVADLTATGTKDSTTFLRGDGTWAVPSGNGAAIVRQHDGTTVAVRPNTSGPVHWIVPFNFTLPLNGTTTGGTVAAVDNLDLVSRY